MASLDFGSAEVDDPGTPSAPRTLAERARADIQARRKRVRTLSHPDAPAWRVQVRLPARSKELEPLLAASKKAVKAGEPPTFDAALLAVYTERIEFKGEEFVDDAGTPLTFRDREFKEAMGLPPDATASQAVFEVWQSDGILDALSTNLLEAAGFGTDEDVEVNEDPTPAG